MNRLQTRYAVKNVPLDFDAERLMAPGYKSRRRGRGPRPNRGYHQSLPLDMSTHCTVYGEPDMPWQQRSEDWYTIHQFTYRGERNGKPVLRAV